MNVNFITIKQWGFHLSFIISVISTCLLLAGCPTTTIFKPERPENNFEAHIQKLLSTAENAPVKQRIENYLLASQLLQTNKQYNRARGLLNQIDLQTVPLELKGFYKIVKAQNLLTSHEIDNSIRIIDSITSEEISYLKQEQHIQLAKLKADQRFAKGNYIGSINELIFISPLLSETEKQAAHDTIWQSLQLLDDSAIKAAKKTASPELQAWLELALDFHHASVLSQQNANYHAWKERWPNHPAALLPPTALTQLTTISSPNSAHIAVLLPLTGKFAAAGNAIKNGILVAHFNSQHQGMSGSSLHFYDTNGSQPIASLYQTAIQDGAEFIIGPLRKEKVQELKQLGHFSIPILVLNQDNQNDYLENFYQFSLAVEDEAEIIAEEAFNRGYRDAAILYPSSDWGTRAFEAFRSKWLALGNQLVSATTYAPESRIYTEPVKQLLSPISIKKPTEIKEQTLETSNHSRGIDFIVVIGNENSLLQIKPTLAYFYADDIPVFTTSHGVALNNPQKIDPDLNGITFCDMPWILNENHSLRKHLRATQADLSQNELRLYALGIDSYYLQSLISHQSTSMGFEGVSGRLEVKSNGTVFRHLPCATITDSKLFMSNAPSY